MKTQDRAFHKNWQKNIQKNDGNNIIKRNVYKPFLKIVLLLLIMCTVILVYKWGNKIPDVEILNINKEQSIYQPDTLLSPKLLIKNNSNEPITIEALRAKKDVGDSNIIILESPKGNYKASNKKNIYFYSEKGILDSNKSIFKLIGSIKIESQDGINLTTNNIIYNIKNDIVNGEDKVILIGKWGILKGKGFSYNLKRSIIHLRGNPRLTLYNKGKTK
ncbi:LPS export ABC transporter periplasmic protein LptC [Alphaproteobacteria bacterium]|nr:LPS export ABC transporter periplasmic protein LptC [Alphaproteobacteria bacterium]